MCSGYEMVPNKSLIGSADQLYAANSISSNLILWLDQLDYN